MSRLATAFALVLVGSGVASAYCTGNGMLSGARRVPVYYEDQISPDLTFLNINESDFVHDLKWAIDQWQEKGGADGFPYYAGSSTSSGFIGGAVYVRETSDCSKCDPYSTYACALPHTVGGIRVGTTIWLIRGAVGSECRWDWNEYDGFIPPDAGPLSPYMIHHTLTHELGHGLGLEDEYAGSSCPGWSSVMAQNCAEGEIVARRDIEALQSLYGTINESYTYKESADLGLTWAAASDTNDALPALLRMGTRGVIWFLSNSKEIYSQPMLHSSTLTKVWKGPSGPAGAYTSQQPSGFNASYSWSFGGAAMKSTSNYAYAVRYNDTETNCNSNVKFFLTQDNGVNWGSTQIIGPALASGAGSGISLAYDSNSGRYISTWTNSTLVDRVYNPNRNIYLSVLSDAGASEIASTIVPVDTAVPPAAQISNDAPAIACNNTLYMASGALNCMIAWSETVNISNVIRFRRFKVTAAGVFTFGPLETHGYEAFGAPTLTPMTSSTYPFMIGLKQGAVMYTWRYNASTGAWVDQRSSSASGGTEGLLHGSLAHFWNNGRFETHMKYVDL